MAFLVSFEDSDSDSDSVSEPPPSTRPTTTVQRNEPSTPDSLQRSKPLTLQLKQTANKSQAPPVQAANTPPTVTMHSPPSTPPAKRFEDAAVSPLADLGGRRSIDSVISDIPSLSTGQAREFPYLQSDYSLSYASMLGEGLWSSVYLAHSVPAGGDKPQSALTPPLTPVKNSALPLTYAIKKPTSRSAWNVLTGEAGILSYLTSLPGASTYLVPFYGQDPRNGALVLGAMPSNLEKFIFTKLNTLPEPNRADLLAKAFPVMARHLARGMEFMHSAGVVHADLKPSNILLKADDTTPIPVYADFSSSIPPAHFDVAAEKTASPLGGGTWDFLSPILLKADADPTPRTDIHALAISLLYLIFGASPFDSVGSNVFLRREMIKQNQAINAGLNDLQNFRRLRTLQTTLGWDVQGWIEKGLGTKTLHIREWREDLEKALSK